MALASPQIAVADLRRWLAQMEAHGRAPAAASRRWTPICPEAGSRSGISTR